MNSQGQRGGGGPKKRNENDRRIYRSGGRRRSGAKRKDQPFYKDPLKMVPLVGGVIALIIGVTQLYDRFFPPANASNVSYEYIVDVSRGMRGKIGTKSKLHAVKAHVLAQVQKTPDFPAALRLAGGDECQVAYQPPTVWFREKNFDRFADAFKDVSAGGKSNFAVAVTHAADDLARRSRDVGSAGRTSVFVLVGSADTCSPDPKREIDSALRDLKQEKNAEVNFKFIGVRPSKKTQRILKSASKDADALGFDSAYDVARRPSDLDRLLPCKDESPTENEYGGCQ